MRTKFIILMLASAAICICCSKPQSLTYGQQTQGNQGGNTGGEKPPVVSDSKYSSTLYDTLKIMTFNILMSHASDTGVQRWSVRKPACMKMIKELKPDIIGLQECPQSQYNDFLSALPDYAGRNIPENRKNFGTSILYRKDRFKLKESGYLWFSDSPTQPSTAWPAICDDPCYRTYIWTDLELKDHNRTIYFYTTHFPRNYTSSHPNNEARKRCSQAIVDHASQRLAKDDAVIVTGDLNCKLATETESLQPFLNWMNCSWRSLPNDAHDWYRAHNSYEEGCPKYGIDESVDHIFFRNLEPLSYKTVWEPYENVRYLSDHYPILFTTLVSYQEEVGSQTSDNGLEGYENGEKEDIW